ncbi:hypothetical protein LPJ70_002656 [Coemansia sp. RSA 2708]|nr:hypothetical protein LPJ70_002656 [Coemansia sp. RSA 2708]
MMSFRETANDLTTKKRDGLVKQYEDLQSKLHMSRAENEHLVDMIVEAFPDLGHDVSSCSSSDEHASHSDGNVSPLHAAKRLPPGSPPHMTKRRRRQGRRDDRSRPKPVEPLPRAASGRLALPVVLGRAPDQVEIHALGRVISDPDTYHTARYIWPPGFRSTRVCPSLVPGAPACVYTSEILEGPDMPVFQVTAADMPDAPFRASSSSGVWKLILDRLTEMGVSVKTHASGPQMYGLSHLGVTKAIQELDNAENCAKYIRQKWSDNAPLSSEPESAPGE